MNPKRQTWIDYARGIAIILVLYRHVFEGIKNSGIDISNFLFFEHLNILLFSFRMPLFFIISGLFVENSLQKRGLLNFIKSKSSSILYPYFLWGGLQITLQIILSNYVNANRSMMDYLYLFYLPKQIDQFWYLYALFNVSFIYAVSRATININNKVNLFVGFLLYYFSAIASQNSIPLGFLGDIMHYYIFYIIGAIISKKISLVKNINYLESSILNLILLPIFLALQIYFLNENLRHSTKYYDYVEYNQPLIFLLISLIGCLFVICFSFLLQRINKLTWLNILGSYSLYIYVAHVLVLASVRIFFTKVLGVYNVPFLFVSGFFFGLTIPILLYRLSVKYNFQWIFSLEKWNSVSVKV